MWSHLVATDRPLELGDFAELGIWDDDCLVDPDFFYGYADMVDEESFHRLSDKHDWQCDYWTFARLRARSKEEMQELLSESRCPRQ